MTEEIGERTRLEGLSHNKLVDMLLAERAEHFETKALYRQAEVKASWKKPKPPYPAGRREILQTALAGIVGLAGGFSGGYVARAEEERPATEAVGQHLDIVDNEELRSHQRVAASVARALRAWLALDRHPEPDNPAAEKRRLHALDMLGPLFDTIINSRPERRTSPEAYGEMELKELQNVFEQAKQQGSYSFLAEAEQYYPRWQQRIASESEPQRER